jgi:hypothetical protein
MPSVDVVITPSQMAKIHKSFMDGTRLSLLLDPHNKTGVAHKLYLFPVKHKDFMIARLSHKKFRLSMSHDELLGSGFFSILGKIAKGVTTVLPHVIEPAITIGTAIHQSQQGGGQNPVLTSANRVGGVYSSADFMRDAKNGTVKK